MIFGKNKFNFTFIGAGSMAFTCKLVVDIVREECIHGGELRLVDLDAQKLQLASEAVSKIVDDVRKETGKDFTVKTYTDFHPALVDMDFIIFTFVTGSYPSWHKDIEICTRHGVLQSVGDTIGPGGISRALRNVPIVVEIGHEMEKVCPDAWAINYSNPEGAIGLALEGYTKVHTFSLCHGTPDTIAALAREVFHVEPSEVAYRAAGINHLTWITEMRINGEDMYPMLREKLIETGYNKKEPISFQLFDIFGLYPAPGDRHVGEFFPFYLKEDMFKKYDFTWKNNDFKANDQWRKEALERFEKLRSGEMHYTDFGESGETATHFIRALSQGETTKEMANVQNRGYIENVSDDIVVEVPVFIDQFGLHPQKIGRLPAAIAAKCDALGREYRLMVEAAVRCDKQLALQAMMLDPLMAHCDEPELLLNDLLDAYRDDLPEGWKKYL